MNNSLIKTTLLVALLIAPKITSCFLDDYFDENNELIVPQEDLREKALRNNKKLQQLLNNKHQGYSDETFCLGYKKYKTFDELKKNLLNYFINGNKQDFLLKNHLYLLTTITIKPEEAPTLTTSMIRADYSSRNGLIIVNNLLEMEMGDDNRFKAAISPLIEYYYNMFSADTSLVSLSDDSSRDKLGELKKIQKVLECFSEQEPNIPPVNPMDKISIPCTDLTGLKDLFSDPRTKARLTEGLIEGIVNTPAIVNLLKSDAGNQEQRAKELSDLLHNILVRNPRLRNILTAENEASSDQALKDFSTSVYEALIKNAHLKEILIAETKEGSEQAAEEIRAGIESAINKTLDSALKTATEDLIERVIKTPAIVNLLKSDAESQEQRAKELSDLLHGILIRNPRLRNILTAESEESSDQALKDFSTSLYSAFIQNAHLKEILTAGTPADSEQKIKALTLAIENAATEAADKLTKDLSDTLEKRFQEAKVRAYNTSFLGKIKPLQATDNPSAVKAVCPQIIQWSFLISACGYIGYKSAELARKGIVLAGKKSFVFAKQKYSDWKNKKQEEKPQEEPDKQPEPEAPNPEMEAPVENADILNPELAK